MAMRFPSIAAVAAELREVNKFYDTECDVRLQVYENICWAVRSGDSQYDLDHTGFWGSSSVPGSGKRFNSREVARDLIEQAKEDYLESQIERIQSV